MEINDIMKDQKTLIAIGVGLVIIIAIVALLFMGGGKEQQTHTTPSYETKPNNSETESTTSTTPKEEKVEIKTQKVDKTTGEQKAKIVIDFSGYNVYVTDCVRNGDYILAKAAYFPTINFDAVLYDVKNNKIYFIKDNKVYETDAELTGDVNSCETTKEDLTKGLDLTKANPIENLIYG